MIDGYLHRIQLGALVAAARASTPADAALVTMLGLLGLGISGACHADIEDPATIDPDLRAGGGVTGRSAANISMVGADLRLIHILCCILKVVMRPGSRVALVQAPATVATRPTVDSLQRSVIG